MKEVAFLVPICSYNNPTGEVEEQHFDKLFLTSFLKHQYDCKVRIYCGYNDDDPVYSNEDNRTKIQDKINLVGDVHITWISLTEEYKGKPAQIWTELSKHAIVEGYEYLFIVGDDIVFPNDNGWIIRMIKSLKTSDNIGIAAGDSGNPNLPMTQFMIHKKHYDMFGWIFPPQIDAWFCDNWIQEIYPKKNIHYFPEYKLLNKGGEPRYRPKDDRRLCAMLVKRHKPRVIRELNK